MTAPTKRYQVEVLVREEKHGPEAWELRPTLFDSFEEARAKAQDVWLAFRVVEAVSP